MSIYERLHDFTTFPLQMKLQREANRAYRKSTPIPLRFTQDPILQNNPMFYEHGEQTPLANVIAVWKYLSDMSWEKWQETSSKQAISVLYALINDYDDYIDSSEVRLQQPSRRDIEHTWRFGRANEQRPLFREMVGDLLWYFDYMKLSAQERRYILRKLVSLKKIALDETLGREFADNIFSLESAKIVRERTCRPFGELTAAVLSGKNCLTETGQKAERIMGTWFITAQVLEDLLDVGEDITQHNLSFVTGVLQDNPEELTIIEARVQKSQKRLSFSEIKSLAPKSYSSVEKTFHEYLKKLPDNKKGRFLQATLRNALYVLLPIRTLV